MNSDLPTTEGPNLTPTADGHDGIFFFPVRHYSPASARFFLEMATALNPAAVLIEGPVDFNASLGDLFLGHRLPVAIYAYVRYTDKTTESAFYPLCDYSPEWQAAKWAWEHDVRVEFIDLSWGRLNREHARAHRYSDDDFLNNAYVDRVCERLQVEDFDALWDVLFEIPTDLDWRTYTNRCHEFCHHMREFGPAESPENSEREAFMTTRIREVRAQVSGPIIVVTGGYHSSGLLARVREKGQHTQYTNWRRVECWGVPLGRWDPRQRYVATRDLRADLNPTNLQTIVRSLVGDDPPNVEESGISLTPFTYPRIDSMSGYLAGVHGPAFYDYVWSTRLAGEPVDCRPLLYAIVGRLRNAGQIASTADVVAIETTARALARIRGREEIWRFDLLDAVSAALVKEKQETDYVHPVMVEARRVLSGDRRGTLAVGTRLPPLVKSVHAQLDALGMTPSDPARRVTLDLERPEDLERSRTLHQCLMLEVAGIKLDDGPDFLARDDLSTLSESWSLRWSPEFEASLIENAIYGADLGQAAKMRLAHQTRAATPNAKTAAEGLLAATLMGFDDLDAQHQQALRTAVLQDGDFFRVATALGHFAFIASYSDVFGAAAKVSHEWVDIAFDRAIWLFESLGSVKDRHPELLAAVQTIRLVFRRRYRSSASAYKDYVGAFGRVSGDRSQDALTRGCAMGALFSVGELQHKAILTTLQGFSDPLKIGDFLLGLFALAREAAQRDPALMVLLDQIIVTASPIAFLEMLPGVRLAFTFFSPLEKHALIDVLMGAGPTKPMAFDAETIALGHDLAYRMTVAAHRFGLRGAGEVPIPEAPAQEAKIAGPPMKPKSEAPSQTDLQRTRWRLVMGSGSEDKLGDLDDENAAQDQMLGFLYDREYGRRNIRSPLRRAGLGKSELTVPEWVNGIHTLFPKRTIERLEADALNRYQLDEIVTRPDILRRAQPNMTLLKAVLRTKHLMNREVLDIARMLTRRVIDDLMTSLATQVKSPFFGARDRRHRSRSKIHANFDPHETIRRNLKHFDPTRGRLLVTEPSFFSRVKPHVQKWKVIIVVDQSGSMLDSVIHSAVTASVFCGLKAIHTHLIAFDTEIVDLSHECADPVETLMRVQLGGGTDIANALEYAYSKVDTPSRTLCILVSDFYEGGPVSHLLAVAQKMVDTGVTLLGLAALDSECSPIYDRETAQKLVELGASVGAMTPGELAQWVAEQIR